MKNYDTAAAVACLGGVFLDILKGGEIGLSGFEREAVLVGHMTIAAAAALALESYDDELCASLPAGSRISWTAWSRRLPRRRSPIDDG